MAMEIELKAWVEDPALLEGRLRERCRYEGGFRKEDVYFVSPPPRREEFRLRAEGGKAVVTWKGKNRRSGMEMNDEREFEVSDGAEFTSLMGRLGCTVFLRKVKEGLRFTSGDVTLELVRVEGLGDFIEIEKLVEPGDPAAVDSAAAEVRRHLAELGVDEGRIEPRYYAELLRRGDGYGNT